MCVCVYCNVKHLVYMSCVEEHAILSIILIIFL